MSQCNPEEAIIEIANHEDNASMYSNEYYAELRSGTSQETSDRVIFENNNMEEIIETIMTNEECTDITSTFEDEIEIISPKEKSNINTNNNKAIKIVIQTCQENSDGAIFDNNNTEDIIQTVMTSEDCTDVTNMFEGEIEIISLKEKSNINNNNNIAIENVINREIKDDNTGANNNKKRVGKWDRNENKWKVNVNKKRRERGATYKGRKNVNGEMNYDIPKEKRTMKKTCNCKASLNKSSRLKCREFVEEERRLIFKKFWKGLDWKQKKTYISCMLEMKETKRARNRKNETSRRKCSIEYYMTKGETKLRVCKTMFLNTHGIGEFSALQWKKENSQLGEMDSNSDDDTEKSEPDQSRKRTARNEALKPRVDCLQLFLKDLPKLESHYCRASTSKLYLEPIWKSKRSLYDVYAHEWCSEKNVKPLSIFTFEKYFAKFNLSLYIPKKDQCEICAEHEAGNLDDTKFQQHQIRKREARNEKQIDKESNNLVYTVDVQAVLLSPLSNVSANYFRTKLITHNYTIFDLKTHDGFCYLWNEAEGGVTADNFASLLCNFLAKEVIPNKKNAESDIILYSDGCASQNRNSTLANALLNISALYSVTIIQKYLEVGHTQMEVDTMHSVIERRMRNVKINVPADYEQICRTARKKPCPYNVVYVTHNFFKNFNEVLIYPNIRPGKKAGDPQVSDLRQLKYTPERKIYYKLNHSDQWTELQVSISILIYAIYF